jgi:hypothetical protein
MGADCWTGTAPEVDGHTVIKNAANADRSRLVMETTPASGFLYPMALFSFQYTTGFLAENILYTHHNSPLPPLTLIGGGDFAKAVLLPLD